MKKFAAIILPLIAAVAFPQSAIAVPVAHRDELNNIIISGTGLVSGTLVKIYYPGVLDSKTVSTGACNLLTIKETSSFEYAYWIKINGFQLNLSKSQVPTLTAPGCVNGVPNPAYTWITSGAYKYVQGYKKIYVIAPSAGQFSVSGDLPNHRLGKVDSCGRISIKNSAKWPIAALNFQGSLSYIVGESYGPDIPIPTTTTTAMPICRKGTLYRKQ
jgi:hypothetical protein